MSGFKLETRDIKLRGDKILEAKYKDGKLAKYTKAMNFKAFYMELHDVFLNNDKLRILDSLGTPADKEIGNHFNYQARFGEHGDAGKYNNRTGDMFEKMFIWNLKPGGATEFEMVWEGVAPIPYSGYGWVDIKIYIVCRRIIEKEILVGSEKKVLQEGAWEVRNRFTYKNNIIPNVIAKIPVVKNSEMLQSYVFNYFYLKDIENDLDAVEEKLIPMIDAVFEKHFL